MRVIALLLGFLVLPPGCEIAPVPPVARETDLQGGRPPTEHAPFGLPIYAEGPRSLEFAGRREPMEDLGPLQLLTRTGYLAGYSAKARAPIWVSYRLTRDYVDGRQHLPHEQVEWGPDPELPAAERATLQDYRRTSIRPVRLAPLNDMRGRSAECEREANLLSNSVPGRVGGPQWHVVSELIRHWAQTYGEVWVVCGAAHYGALFGVDDANVRLNLQGETPGRVRVQPGVFKIVIRKDVAGRLKAIGFLFPTRGQATEFWPELKQKLVSIDRIERETGLDLFSSLPDEIETALEERTPTKLWPHPRALRRDLERGG